MFEGLDACTKTMDRSKEAPWKGGGHRLLVIWNYKRIRHLMIKKTEIKVGENWGFLMITYVIIVLQFEKTNTISEYAVCTGSFERSFFAVRGPDHRGIGFWGLCFNINFCERNCEGVGRGTRMNEVKRIMLKHRSKRGGGWSLILKNIGIHIT